LRPARKAGGIACEEALAIFLMDLISDYPSIPMPLSMLSLRLAKTACVAALALHVGVMAFW
jgi:hypothetical protein